MQSNKGHKRGSIDGLNQHRLETLGAFLKHYRQNQLLSRKELESQHGISKGILERLESGQNITLHSLLRIMDVFMLRPQDVFEGIE